MSAKTSSPDSDAEEYWQYVERVAKQVETWPAWKRGKRAQSEDEASTNSTSSKGPLMPEKAAGQADPVAMKVSKD